MNFVEFSFSKSQQQMLVHNVHKYAKTNKTCVYNKYQSQKFFENVASRVS